MTPLQAVHSASGLSTTVLTAWHGIVGVLNNLAGLGRRIELGPSCVATVAVARVQTECFANSG
jgi:hypothetical protein